MAEEIKNISDDSNSDNNIENNNESPLEEAGTAAIICSALFPIIGIIIFFVNRKEVKNPGVYLAAAGIGIAIGILCGF